MGIAKPSQHGSDDKTERPRRQYLRRGVHGHFRLCRVCLGRILTRREAIVQPVAAAGVFLHEDVSESGRDMKLPWRMRNTAPKRRYEERRKASRASGRSSRSPSPRAQGNPSRPSVDLSPKNQSRGRRSDFHRRTKPRVSAVGCTVENSQTGVFGSRLRRKLSLSLARSRQQRELLATILPVAFAG